TVLANSVRVPKVHRGEVIMVGRYNEASPKAAIIAPEDLDMLEDTHTLMTHIAQAMDIPVDELTLKARALEDTPDAQSVTDPEAIIAALGL
ncbi:MAG TPA: hypothetical protein VG293_03250, partial [Solirubrobacteraceae bacterium]|nr:hypothetical protein [Solirubrobacteraceae bacterium]